MTHQPNYGLKHATERARPAFMFTAGVLVYDLVHVGVRR